MNLVNLITICSFVAVVLIGVMVLTVQDMRNHQPHARIRTRMQQSFTAQVGAREGRRQA